MVWVVGLASAFGIKLSSSIDDVVWLAPFLTSNSPWHMRIQNAIIYTSVCLVQTIVAMAIAYSGSKVVAVLTQGRKDAWSTEKILTVSAGCLLTLYSCKLTYEYIQECNEEGSDDKDDPQSVYSKVATEEGAQADGEKGLSARGNDLVRAIEIDNPNRAEEELDKADKERQQTLFVIAFIGSVDDLTLFVPMLVGKGFDVVQLMSGAFLAAFAIVTLCMFIGQCKPVADCLSSIPLAAIVIVFAVVLLLKGLVFDEEH
mmetsp:Transcript_108034/g.170715  ORF Transcript_108034/g.170715 Transcript_108034/m.170715 type:complete len:258 (-) Transcript_108034:6-779(-)